MSFNPSPAQEPEYQPPSALARLRRPYDWTYYTGPAHLVLVPFLLVAAFVTGFWIFWAWAAISFLLSVVTIRLTFRDVRRRGDIPHAWYWQRPA